jgi:hypothetical protein
VTHVEDRLRAATRAAGETIGDGSAPPLDLSRSVRAPRRLTSPGRQRAWRLVAPLTAAAAVIAIAATLAGVAGQPRHPATPAPSASRILHKLPRYYMALTGSHVNGPYNAVIKNTLTGAVLATIRPALPVRSFSAVAGGADDRTFVLAAQAYKEPAPVAWTRLYLARFSPSTGKVKLTWLHITLPAGTGLTGLALSPDDSELAVSLGTGNLQKVAQVRVYTLATDAVRVWQDQGFAGASPAGESLSWDQRGYLGVNYALRQGNSESVSNAGVLLLDTATGGGSLLTSSSLAACSSQNGLEFVTLGVLTADDTVVAGVAPSHSALGCKQLASKASHRPAVATSLVKVELPVQGQLWWTNASGSIVVVQDKVPSRIQPVYGVLSGGRFVPLPGRPTESSDTAIAF